MLIEFIRVDSGSTAATIHRRDGVVVALHGYDKKFRIPHDLAHAVAERELGLADGVFGSIAGGAVFKGMTVVSGKPRHDAAVRSKRLLDANSKALTRAEVMAGVVHDAVERPTGGSPGRKAGSTGASCTRSRSRGPTSSCPEQSRPSKRLRRNGRVWGGWSSAGRTG